MAPREIREYASNDGPLHVDPAKGVIHQVKILGPESLNGNRYPKETRAKLAPQLDSCRVFIDHSPRGANPGQERSYKDYFGLLKNCRETGDGIFGDLHFPPDHAIASQLCWDAQQGGQVGLSISAECGADHWEDGKRVVEEVRFDKVRHSVDIVSRPATVKICSSLWTREDER